MRRSRSVVVVGLIALVLASSATACRRAIVIVPAPSARYTERDTLYGQMDGNRVRVTFHFDTTLRVDTVTRLDTLWRGGTRTLVRVDTVRLARIDTLIRRDTVRVPSRDSVRLNFPTRPTRVDTVRIVVRDTVVRIVTRVDTVRVGGGARDTVRVVVRDTVRVVVRDTVRVVVRDTVRVVVRDTVRVVVRDTVFRTDTLRLAGRRMLFVPPGQYPPDGQCRVWIHDRPSGQQARPGPCDALGAIPAGAFILFGGEAWDFDFDWVAESRRGAVPAEIVALKRRGGR